MFVTQAKGRVVQQRQVLVDRFALRAEALGK